MPFSYNTWQNEKTEKNRNQRLASFEVLLKSNELHQVIFYSHYDKDSSNKGAPRSGWAHVLTVRDLSRVLHPPLAEAVNELFAVWGNNCNDLAEEDHTNV